ncbi:hypothetical protein HDU93_007438 [Gonapodya sp. JEL0774]|nr:hypothetical protein HDU93_007438 [Gonapodya sp. JEL0774]
MALAARWWKEAGCAGSFGNALSSVLPSSQDSMAGALHSHPNALGNRLLWSEANIVDDPLAAQEALWIPRAEAVPHYLIPLDVTNRIGVTPDFAKQLAHALEVHGHTARLGGTLQAMLTHYSTALTTLGSPPPHGFHDPAAALFLLEPELFAPAVSVSVDVEVRGTLTPGATIADWRGRWGRKKNVMAVLDLGLGGDVAVLNRYVDRLRGWAMSTLGPHQPSGTVIRE